MTNKEKIKAIKKFQKCPIFHELTCGRNGCHGILKPFEMLGRVILSCPDCRLYTQRHIPEFVLQVDYDFVDKYIEKLKTLFPDMKT